MLSGGLLAAICGPSLASSSRTLFGLDFVGSYLMIGVLSLANQSLLSFISFDIGSHSETKVLLQQDEELSRPLVTIFRDPLFLLACGTATLSNTTMVMVMSQFSLEMDKLNYQFAHISLVLEFHLFAMYSPSLFTGHLFNYLSPPTLSILGNLLCIVGIGVMSSTNEYFGYLLGMIIIGISWNIAYSSSTLMLAGCYNVIFLELL